VKRLRDALGDSADNPIFIETLSRRGYRFMAPLTTAGNGHSNGTNGNGAIAADGNRGLVASAAVVTGKWSARFAWWGFAGLLVTAGAGFGGWHAGHPSVRPIQPRGIRLTGKSPDASRGGGARL